MQLVGWPGADPRWPSDPTFAYVEPPYEVVGLNSSPLRQVDVLRDTGTGQHSTGILLSLQLPVRTGCCSGGVYA